MKTDSIDVQARFNEYMGNWFLEAFAGSKKLADASGFTLSAALRMLADKLAAAGYDKPKTL